MAYKDPDRQRKYQREWHASRRAKYFADKACVKCGSTEALRLDHIDPTQKISHKIWSWSETRQQVELAKCQVLCERCHKEKNLEQFPITHGFVPFQHGTTTEYHRGCGCDLCRVRNAETRRRWRARNSTETNN